MNVAEVRRRLAVIRSLGDEGRGDDEAAHSAEIALYEAVLGAIAAGTCEDPIGCATAALTSRVIPFGRYCA